MATGIVGVVVYGDATSTERRCVEGGQIGIGGEATSIVGEVSEPVDESGIDLCLGEAIADGGIVGTSYGERIGWIHGEGSGARSGLPTGVGGIESDGDTTSAGVGWGERGQVGGIDIAPTGEPKLADPSVEVGLDGCLGEAG